MKILLVGSGGREHAIADALSRENTTIELIAAPGNPGIADYARTLPIAVTELELLAEVAKTENVDLVTHDNEHRLHSAIGFITPADRVAGQSDAIWPTRDARLEAARAARRFAHQPIAAQRHLLLVLLFD